MGNRNNGVLALGLFILSVLGCSGMSFTTAHISDLKFGESESAEQSKTTFKPKENIYAIATVSNVPKGKYKLTWKVTYENVKGKGQGEEIGTNTREFEGSNRLWQTFSSPLPGEYKVEATLTDDKEKVVDQKSATVTVSD